MLNKLRSTTIRKCAVLAVSAAVLVSPTSALASPVGAFEYGRTSCADGRWQSKGYSSYEECFDWHVAMFCAGLVPGGIDYWDEAQCG